MKKIVNKYHAPASETGGKIARYITIYYRLADDFDLLALASAHGLRLDGMRFGHHVTIARVRDGKAKAEKIINGYIRAASSHGDADVFFAPEKITNAGSDKIALAGRLSRDGEIAAHEIRALCGASGEFWPHVTIGTGRVLIDVSIHALDYRLPLIPVPQIDIAWREIP